MKLLAHALVAIVIGTLALVACSSENKIGEACNTSGKTTDECESGGICGEQTGGGLQCLKLCVEQTDCPAGTECNGVDGSSLKGCRLKDTTTTGKK